MYRQETFTESVLTLRNITDLIPPVVIEYIEENGLYEEEGTSSIDKKGKAKAPGSGRASPAIESSSSKR